MVTPVFKALREPGEYLTPSCESGDKMWHKKLHTKMTNNLINPKQGGCKDGFENHDAMEVTEDIGTKKLLNSGIARITQTPHPTIRATLPTFFKRRNQTF